MKFVVSKSAIENEVKSLSKVIDKKAALPILSDFMFSVKDNTLTITACDGAMWVQTQVFLDEKEGDDGTFCLPMQELTNALCKLAEQPVTFEVDVQTQHCQVNHSSGYFTFIAEPSDQYPLPHDVNTVATEIPVECDVLKEALSRSLFACAEDELRPVMNGVYFDFLADRLNIVASNGHVLIRNSEYTVHTDHSAAFIMPKKVVKFIIANISREGTTMFRFDDNTCIATFDSTSVIFKLIEGRYPKYDSVIPKSTKYDAIVDRAELANGLKRVNPFSSNNSNLVVFGFEPDKLTLTAQDFDFSRTAENTVACEFDGQPLSVGFKGKTMVEILSVLAFMEVVIQLNDPSHAALVIPHTDDVTKEQITCLIMPMLINA